MLELIDKTTDLWNDACTLAYYYYPLGYTFSFSNTCLTSIFFIGILLLSMIYGAHQHGEQSNVLFPKITVPVEY